MRISLLSAAAVMALTSMGSLPRFFDSGPNFLPPSKKKTGALKQRRASKKRKARKKAGA
jgi:hypothetical protein